MSRNVYALYTGDGEIVGWSASKAKVHAMRKRRWGVNAGGTIRSIPEETARHEMTFRQRQRRRRR